MRHALFQNLLTGLPDFQFEKPRMLSVLVLLKSLRIRNLLLAPLLNGFVVIKAVVVVQATMTIRSLKDHFLTILLKGLGHPFRFRHQLLHIIALIQQLLNQCFLF